MKVKPANIKYTEIDANSPIKHIRDAIGFLLMITTIPNNSAIILKTSKNSTVYPLDILSYIENKEFIIFIK